MPSGVRWCDLRAGGNGGESKKVEDGQVVRVEYVCRLDDGTQVASSIASFRIGNQSAAVCAALDEVAAGMSLGDTRRVRAPPNSRRGHRLVTAPSGEFLEYDVTLTGYVDQMRIMTLDDVDQAIGSDDPLDALVAIGKRSISNLAKSLGFAAASTQKRDDTK